MVITFYSDVGSIHIDTQSMDMAAFLNYDAFLSLNIVFILANSTDPDEMPHNAEFHHGLHCLPKYLFMLYLFYKEFSY